MRCAQEGWCTPNATECSLGVQIAPGLVRYCFKCCCLHASAAQLNRTGANRMGEPIPTEQRMLRIQECQRSQGLCRKYWESGCCGLHTPKKQFQTLRYFVQKISKNTECAAPQMHRMGGGWVPMGDRLTYRNADQISLRTRGRGLDCRWAATNNISST